MSTGRVRNFVTNFVPGTKARGVFFVFQTNVGTFRFRAQRRIETASPPRLHIPPGSAPALRSARVTSSKPA
jgi:hypothetical protein